MKNKKEIFKKLLSYFPVVYKFFQKIYRKHKYGAFFIPFKSNSTIETINKKNTIFISSVNFLKKFINERKI